jgi:hypothetical protein
MIEEPIEKIGNEIRYGEVRIDLPSKNSESFQIKTHGKDFDRFGRSLQVSNIEQIDIKPLQIFIDFHLNTFLWMNDVPILRCKNIHV